jgi:hypothetical protein
VPSITHPPPKRRYPQPKNRKQQKSSSREPRHFLAPKLVLTFFVSLPSVSLSSAAAATAAAPLFLVFFVVFALPPPPAALAGVAALDAPSLLFPKLLDTGVGACEAGVEAGVWAS